jgi:hypothetical protein
MDGESFDAVVERHQRRLHDRLHGPRHHFGAGHVSRRAREMRKTMLNLKRRRPAVRAFLQRARGGAIQSPRTYVLVALVIGLAVGIALGVAQSTPDRPEAAGTRGVTWRCLKPTAANSMDLFIYNGSDKNVTVTINRYDPTGNLLGKSPIELGGRQTQSFGPGAAATIETRVPSTVVVAAYISLTADPIACSK